MERLLEDLTAHGVLDSVSVDWARAHQAEHGVPVDTALLELDLVDEEELLRGLESCCGIPAAHPSDVARVDTDLAARLPEHLLGSGLACPVRLVDDEIAVLVQGPLSDETAEEIRALLEIEPRQLVTTTHHLTLLWQQVQGVPPDERTRRLEARLAWRREAADAGRVLEAVASARTLASAVGEVLDFAEPLVDFSCFLALRDDELRVAAVRGGGPAAGATLPLPESGCTLAAALRHRGFFVGPLAGTEEDHDFYEALGRSLPGWALVVPVLTAGRTALLFCADNGPRGMATRWVAELSLLVSRLGRPGADGSEQALEESIGDLAAAAIEALFSTAASSEEREPSREASEEAPSPSPPLAPPAASEPSVEPEARSPVGRTPADDVPSLTAAETAVLDRLRAAASQAGKTLDAFVDDLLRERGAPPAPETTAVLAGEVKQLFEKLASDIPTQLARGMETAFRELAPRLARTPPAGAFVAGVDPGPSAAASVELVAKPAGPREVPTYRERRRRSKRVKL